MRTFLVVLSFSMALTETGFAQTSCAELVLNVSQTRRDSIYRTSDLILEANNEMAQIGVQNWNPKSIQIYFQELYFNRGTAKSEDRSRLLVLSEPLWTYKSEAVRIGFVVELSTGTREVTMVKESKDSQGRRIFTTTENTVSLFLDPQIRKQGGNEAVALATQSIVASLLKSFPTFVVNPLFRMGVINVTAPKETSLIEKIEFIARVQDLREISASSKLGFNTKDVIVGGQITITPAVDITDLVQANTNMLRQF